MLSQRQSKQAFKLVFLLFGTLLTQTLFAQKNVSYKYELEDYFPTIWRNQKVKAREVIGKKTVNTIFVFDSVKNTIRIGNSVYKIGSISDCAYNLNTGTDLQLMIVNLYDRKNDVEIIVKEGSNSCRFYFKRSSWKTPFGCSQ